MCCCLSTFLSLSLGNLTLGQITKLFGNLVPKPGDAGEWKITHYVGLFYKTNFAEVTGKEHIPFKWKMLSLNVEKWQRICFDSLKYYAGERKLGSFSIYILVLGLLFLTFCSSYWMNVDMCKSRSLSKAMVFKSLLELLMCSFCKSFWIPLVY